MKSMVRTPRNSILDQKPKWPLALGKVNFPRRMVHIVEQ
jgi:hypothetical protein